MGKRLSAWLKALDTVRRVIVNGLFLLIVLLVIVGLFSKREVVPSKAVLVVDPKGDIVEQLAVPGSGLTPFSFTAPRQTRLRDLIQVIHTAKNDKRIRMMALDLQDMGRSSLDKLQAIRQAIEDFRASGKPVVAYADHYTQGQYYLAAAANRVFLHPMGLVALTGFGLYRDYFKDAIDKLGIDVHVYRAGKFKSAMEPFMRNNMSDADRQANQAWLSVLWDDYKRNVAAMRGIDPAHLQAVLDDLPKYLQQYGGSMAKLALGEKWVDQLADEQDVEAYVASKLGLAANQDIPQIHWRDYLRATRAVKLEQPDTAVGIITASGAIMEGDQPPGVIGASTLASEIDDARKNSHIKALVLRVDSPGGSALASETIRQALLRFRTSGKPLVVSMGGMAASGGYWISTAADEIWASPTTLTGSIGVFGLIGDVHDALAKIGIHADGLGTTPIAGALRPDLPVAPPVAQAMQMGVDDIYGRFLKVVAEGRKMPLDRVAPIAEGRVWSGVDAKRLGLVDQLGDLDQAVAAAAARAGISAHYQRQWLAPPRPFWDRLLDRLRGEARAVAPSAFTASAQLPPVVAEVARTWSALSRFNDPRGIYAYCDLQTGVR
jgi:protease IV